MMAALGDQIVRLLSAANTEVIIVAPFIGKSALSRLIDAIPPSIDSRVVTRWRPEDILSGVSDLRILDIAKKRGIPLFLRNDLHAKLYVADNRCLVGSANITETALGWRTPSNLELLVPVDREDSIVREFIKGLYRNTVLANDLQRDRLQLLLDDVRQQKDFSIPSVSIPNLLPANWVPTIKTPQDLYALYSGDEQRVLKSAIDVTRADLRRFCVPLGLNEAGFRSWVGAMLAQTPIVEKTINYSLDISESVFQGLLSDVGADAEKYPVRDRMIVLQRWLEYFLTDDYELVTDSVKLVRSKRLYTDTVLIWGVETLHSCGQGWRPPI